MSEDEIIEEVANLFIQTGESHHSAFIASDGLDPEWPLWYADRLHPKLGTLLNTTLTKSEIVYLLVMLDKQRAEEVPDSNWPIYYAKILISEYLSKRNK
jgi:hypothetical protein